MWTISGQGIWRKMFIKWWWNWLKFDSYKCFNCLFNLSCLGKSKQTKHPGSQTGNDVIFLPVIPILVVDCDVENWMNISDRKFKATLPRGANRFVLRVRLASTVVQLQDNIGITFTTLRNNCSKFISFKY
jgi:hypothetical protein